MPTNHPYDLVIGLDRSDRKADLHLIDTRTGNAQKLAVTTSPEALHDWLARVRQDHPQDRVAICLEQPAANLIVFLETYSWITLYPINPSASRNSARPSSPVAPRTTARMPSIWPSCS